MRTFLLSISLLVSLLLTSCAQSLPANARSWKVDGVERQAIVYVPPAANKTKTPVIFAFHGHGGNMRYSSKTYAYHKHWPEAIVVYMQGLPTPGGLVDPQGRLNGWQNRVGLQGDRDLKFFDTVFASLKKDYQIDEKRVFSAGHSNGGGFTYLLWAERPDIFAAFAPAAAFTVRANTLKPKPAIHIAGESDPLVKFEWQKRCIDAVLKVDGCALTGKPWAKSGDLVCTMYPSSTGTPFVTAIGPGNHTYPKEAPALTIKFFKEVTEVKDTVPDPTSLKP